MTRRGFRYGIASAWVVAAAGLVGAQQVYEFTDKGDNMKVTASDWFLDTPSKGVYEFTGMGKAVTGKWKSQGLTIVTSQIDGKAVAATRGKMELLSAVMTGGVRATIQRASTNVRSAVKQTVIVTGKQATYLADANRLNVSGGVKVVNDDPGARRSMTMTGKTASVVLSRPSGAGARSAVQSSSVQGPVLFELDTTEVDSDGITHVAHIEGSADNVDYAAGSSRDARQERTVHLTGSVHIIRTESAKKADGSEVEGSKRTQVFEGSSATLNIGAVPDLPGQETVTSATVDGPVTFTMDGSRLETSKKTDKKTHTTTTETAWTPYHIESKSDSLTYTAFDTADERGATSELTLLGHVSVKGTILGASLRGIDRAELWLDPQGDVVKANLHGAHGVVKVKPPQVGLASRPSSLIPVKPGYAT